jgi:FKBP-type peptidyl-prolyl cis-trans isomerase (trigger factor)
LILTEVAKAEQVSVSDQDVAAEIERLKTQYSDAEMQRELDRPETREEVYNHLMASRTIAKIRSYNEAN